MWSVPLLVIATGERVQAQTSSLYGAPDVRQPLTLASHSWYFIPPPPVKQIELNDIITVIVKENSQVIAEGEVQRRTQSNFDARLRNWIQFRGFSLNPLPTSVGEPRARGSFDNQANTTAEIQTSDSIVFRIAARVVDIRPNGNLVIEGHSSITNNDEVREHSISGVVRREDIAPDNTVMSEKVLEAQIHKRDTGAVRDAYRRGWLLKTFDRFKPI
jgi:flagellar L-ring protein precursor FlgH